MWNFQCKGHIVDNINKTKKGNVISYPCDSTEFREKEKKSNPVFFKETTLKIGHEICYCSTYLSRYLSMNEISTLPNEI